MGGIMRASLLAVAAFFSAVAVVASASALDDSTVSLSEAAFGPVPLLGKVGRTLDASDTAGPREATLNNTYRLGSEWGKRPVTKSSLREATPAFRRAALATARAGGATSFYLGRFADKHVMATNHHVFPTAGRCQSGSIRFPLLGKDFRCSEFLGTWTNIDLSLFVIDVQKASDAGALEEVGANFDFSSPLRKGQPLVTVGFGVADNPLRQLVGNDDSDCKVFSPDDTFRLMADPDRLNPGTYEAWSFANGCDVSHGDSGSAMVDRDTGLPVGLIWTGRIPKAASVQDSLFLDELIDKQSSEVWEELSYGVPAAKIKSELLDTIAAPGTQPSVRVVLEALVAE
jgi:hypothetical protein